MAAYPLRKTVTERAIKSAQRRILLTNLTNIIERKVRIKINDSELEAFREVVGNSEFRVKTGVRFFVPGDKVLVVSMHSTNRRDALALFAEFKKRWPKLKKEGYKGFYADTPNTAIVRFLEMRGAKITVPPRLMQVAVREFYIRSTHTHGWPQKYAATPVKRLMFKF